MIRPPSECGELRIFLAEFPERIRVCRAGQLRQEGLLHAQTFLLLAQGLLLHCQALLRHRRLRIRRLTSCLPDASWAAAKALTEPPVLAVTGGQPPGGGNGQQLRGGNGQPLRW